MTHILIYDHIETLREKCAQNGKGCGMSGQRAMNIFFKKSTTIECRISFNAVVFGKYT